MSQSHWTRTRLQPAEAQTIPDTDTPDLGQLENTLSQNLFHLDGRGRYAQAHFDLRDGDTEYYFIYMSGWNNIKTECHSGRFDYNAINHDAIDAVFMYHRGTRALEATFPQGVDRARHLEMCEIWAKLMKGCHLEDEARERPPHSLDQFMAGEVPPPPDHEHRMVNARVIEVCFTVCGLPGYRHAVTEQSDSLWRNLEQHLNHNALPSCLCHIEYVKIRMTLDSSYGTSSRQTLRITPDGDNIGEKSPKVQALLRGLLVLWGLPMQSEMRDFTALLTLPPDTSLSRRDLPRSVAFSGLFHPTGKYADAMPCPCGCGSIAAIEEGEDSLTACALCPEGGVYDVSKDRLELLVLDEPSLRALVSREFGCGNGCGVSRGDGLFDLGMMREPLDKTRRKVYFCQRLDGAVKAALPNDRGSLLVVGSEYHSLPAGWFDGRILDFAEFFLLDGDAVRLDRDLLNGHFGGGLTSTKKPENKGTRKDKMKTRIANIKLELRAHLKSAFDAYWHKTSDGTSAMTLLPPPTLKRLCGVLMSTYNEEDTLTESTVQRTIKAAMTRGNACFDAEFKMLWEGCRDVNFVRQFASKNKGH